MLRGIHKASATWLGKGIMAAVMGLLALSFAIWGIGDIFRGFGRSTAIVVGGTEIGIEKFRNYYTDRMNQFSRRLGKPITPDQARALGLDRQLIGQLVAETALDERAHQLGLGIGNDEIAKRITADPNFQGLNGRFDASRFQQLIRQIGYTETTYVAEQRAVMLRRQIGVSISGDIVVPAAAEDAINQFQNEKRNADVVTLSAAQAGNIATPDEAALKKYFDERKTLFRAPEYRQVTLLILSAENQARWKTVPDADAKAYYEQHKSDYGTPEKRDIRQIVFPKADDARAASEKIAKGASFDDIVKERGLKPSDTDLGLVTKANMIDPKVGEAAFSTPEGGVSAPVEGRFGAVIIQVKKIEPAQQKTYEQVADEIKKTLAQTKARSEIADLRDKVEDERAGGATLAEVGKKLNIATRTVDAIDRSGRNPAGQPVTDLPKGVDVVNTAFSADVGVETDPLQLPGGGFVWVDVTGVTPSRERTLDEVKDQVTARWREDEIATRLKTKADDMLAKLKSGAAIAQVASENGATVATVAGLQRGQGDKVPAGVLDAIFKTAKGQAGTAEGKTRSERAVFVVTGIDTPKLDPNNPQTKQIAETLQRGYSEDVLGEYVARLENDLGVKLNQEAINQALGRSAPQ